MTLFARAVFLALVGATFGAFFVAGELKSRPPVVTVRGVAQFFSPNGDGERDVNAFSVRITEADDVTVSIVDADGDLVKRLLDGEPLRAHVPKGLEWDGTTAAGARAPDGTYHVRVVLRRQNRAVQVPGPIRLDTTPPRLLVRVSRRQPGSRVRLAARAPLVVGPVAGEVKVLVRGLGPSVTPELRVWRADVEPARQVAAWTGRRGRAGQFWDGLADGVPAPPGTYLIEARGPDRAGNVGSSAPGLPQLPLEVRGAPGVTVRSIAAQAPAEPVRAGTRATFFVDARGRAFRWRVRRLGSARIWARGRTPAGRPLSFTAPDGPSGVYLLEYRAGVDTGRVPFAVQSQRKAPILVVLPTITWFGRDRVDDDGDGLPDTLTAGGPVRWPRVIAGTAAEPGLPQDFATQVAPLLVYFDRVRIPFDVTTDLALAASRDPRATDRDGVLVAGSARWIPRTLARRLRAYVTDGGRVATFGTETLRAGVTVNRERLVRPTQPAADDVFGTRLEPVRGVAADPPALEPIADEPDLGLFTGFAGALEGFHRWEESARPTEQGVRLLAGLGRPVTDAEQARADAEGTALRDPLPSLAASFVGKGLVIRVGLPGWPSRIAADADVAQIHHNIVDLLRRVRPKPRSPLK